MILSRLKEATRPQHSALEDRVDVGRRAGTIEGYKGLLARFHGFYAPVEAALAAIPGWEAAGIDLSERMKTSLIRQDLTALGLSDADIAALPRCEDIPAWESLAGAFGTLYVLEGATLGGQVIRRQVEQSLGIDRERGCAFFGSYGDRVGPMWKSFGEALTNYATTGDRQEDAIRAATSTFEKFDRWFAEGPARS